MNGIAFKGDVKNAVAELKNEAQQYKGWTLADYIRLKRVEEVEKKQFGKN